MIATDVDECDDKDCHKKDDCFCMLSSRKQRIFEEAENAATEVMYRCISCRNCQGCRNGARIESISIREEVEQDLIDKSVHVDIDNQVTVASLALAAFSSQLKKLGKCPQSKADVINSESKLQSLGHVNFVKNLTANQQNMLKESRIQNYIPWRAVWNENSLSTPCRVVFDASSPTKSGCSLNDVLAKGRNTMNPLIEILLRWSTQRIGFHTDVHKMYNSVKLREADWCYQMYIWEEDLNPNAIPEEKVIKTLIYGVKPSGNQSEYGLRQTTSLSKYEYPDVLQIIQNVVYFDDCVSGEASIELAHQRVR